MADKLRQGVFLIGLLCCLFAAAFSESSADADFLQTLASYPGTEVHEDGTWLFQSMAKKAYTDGEIVFGLEASTYRKEQDVLVCIFAGLRDLRDNPMASVSKLDVIIGEGRWTWSNLIDSNKTGLAFLTALETDFLEALAEAEVIQVQIHMLTKQTTLAFAGEDLRLISEMARALVDLNIPQMVRTDTDSMSGQYTALYPVKRHGTAKLHEPAADSLASETGE